MSDIVKIAVDAMSREKAPKKVIDGIIHHYSSNKDIFYKIFGDELKIKMFFLKFLVTKKRLIN